MKIIAKQIPPEYQESPLFLGADSWPENVEEIEMLEFTGWSRTPVYSEVIPV